MARLIDDIGILGTSKKPKRRFEDDLGLFGTKKEDDNELESIYKGREDEKKQKELEAAQEQQRAEAEAADPANWSFDQTKQYYKDNPPKNVQEAAKMDAAIKAKKEQQKSVEEEFSPEEQPVASRYSIRDPRHPQYDKKKAGMELLYGINATVKAAFPVLWGEATISGAGVAIQEGKDIKEIFKAVPDNLRDYGKSIIQDLARAQGKNIPHEDLVQAKGFSELWANYYKAITGKEAPIWYSAGAGTASLIGLSVASPEFKILAQKTSKALGAEGKDVVTALKTHNAMLKALRGDKKEFVGWAVRRGIPAKEAEKMGTDIVKELLRPSESAGQIDTGLLKAYGEWVKPSAAVGEAAKKGAAAVKPTVKAPVVKPKAPVVKPKAPIVKPKAPLKTQAIELGKKAFKSGIVRTPVKDKELMKLLEGKEVGEDSTEIMSAWTEAWDKENLKPEKKPEVKPQIEKKPAEKVPKAEKPTPTVKEFLKGVKYSAGQGFTAIQKDVFVGKLMEARDKTIKESGPGIAEDVPYLTPTDIKALKLLEKSALQRSPAQKAVVKKNIDKFVTMGLVEKDNYQLTELGKVSLIIPVVGESISMPGTVHIKIPDDGEFNVANNVKAINEILKRLGVKSVAPKAEVKAPDITAKPGDDVTFLTEGGKEATGTVSSIQDGKYYVVPDGANDAIPVKSIVEVIPTKYIGKKPTKKAPTLEEFIANNRKGGLSDEQLKTAYKEMYPKVKGRAPAGGASAAVVSEEVEKKGPRGFGVIEPSEKTMKPRPAKTDYSKVAEEMPTEKFNIIDELLKVTSPAARKGLDVKRGAVVLRKHISELAHKDVVISETLKKAHKAFTWMSEEDVLDFMDRVEAGESQENSSMQPVANLFRKILDSRRVEVQGLGKGHLESFYENYFPHIWEDPTKAKNVIGTILGRKRLEGTKAFLKERKIMTIKEGLERGLELVSDNPVDLVMLKVHEMDRYIMAQNIIKDLKEQNLIKFVYSRSKTPQGYVRLNDNVFTVFMPPEMIKKDMYDLLLVDQLLDVAQSLGIDSKRFVSIGGRRAGFARGSYGETGGEVVRTKYASPESVLAHEIGHVLGFRYKLYDVLRHTHEGEMKTRVRGKNKGKEYWVPSEEAVEYREKIDKQWRALADARFKDVNVPEGFKKYVRKGREKEAVMIEAMIHAPAEFKKTAPDLFKSFKAFLNEHSELRPLLDVKPSLVLGESDAKIKVPGFTTLGFYTAPEDVGLLINNYLSPGLRNAQNKIVSGTYNLARGVGNILNQIQLSLSLFHGLNVTTDMMASTFGLGLRKLMSKGQRISGVADLATWPVAPVKAMWEGTRIRKAYTKSLDQISDPRLRTMVKAVVEAGGRDRLDTMYYNQQIKALQNTFSEIFQGDVSKKLKGIAKLPLNLAGSLIESLAKPLMEWYVPTGKMGLFSKLASHEMERLEQGEITPQELEFQLMSVWDSVDNRMGQLVYDNLFWNKVLKDVLMLAVRSVGWNLGSWREYGGAILDVGTAGERIRQGDKFLSHKMSYAIGAVVVYAVLGASIMYILTGKPPEEPKDYFFPKTGKKNPDGSEERLSLPTYAKDWYAYSHQPGKTVTHKIHPLWGLLGDITANQDYFGTEIRHEGDPALDQMYSVVEHISKQARPISAKNFEKMSRTSEDTPFRNIMVSITGITSAPSYITRSPAQKLMTRYVVEKIPRGTRTKEASERSLYRKVFINRVRKGEKVSDREAVDILGAKGYTRAKKEALKAPFEVSYNRLSLKEALNVFIVATPKEKEQVVRILQKKYFKYRNRLDVDENTQAQELIDKWIK